MKFYSVKHKNNQIQKVSSSGGAFTALSDVILSQGGKIIGGGYNYNAHIVEHRVCTTPEERDQLRGSKYIQSDLKDIFRQIKTEIEQNTETHRPILFIGTPCQVMGLKCFLEKTNTPTEDLYLCDIICHGVPSPGVWKTFIRKRIKGKNVEYITFKDKRLGWKQPLAFATVDGKEKSLRSYTLLYFGELITRPCCNSCPFTSVNRISDITIGDHWGIESIDPEFYSKKGVSLVIVNSEQGRKLFDAACEYFYIRERTEAQCLQPNLCHPSVPHSKRESFWKMYYHNPELAVVCYDVLVAGEKVLRRLMK